MYHSREITRFGLLYFAVLFLANILAQISSTTLPTATTTEGTTVTGEHVFTEVPLATATAGAEASRISAQSTTSPLVACGGHLVGPSDFFGFNPVNLPEVPSVNCTWVIEVEPNMLINLTFNLTCSELCTGNLSVYDGRNTLASEIGVYTTSVYLYVVGSTGNYMTVSYLIYYPFLGSELVAQYTSSYRITGNPVSTDPPFTTGTSGAEASPISAQTTTSTLVKCGGHLVEPSGFFGFTTVNLPEVPSVNCTWVIEVEPNMLINLTFNLTCGELCLGDLSVYDGRNTLASEIGVYTIPVHQYVVGSTNNYMTVSYVIYYPFLGSELEAWYNSSYGITGNPVSTDPPFTIGTAGAEASPISAQTTASPLVIFGGHLVRPFGFFGFTPVDLPEVPSVNCTWVIEVEPNMLIYLTFNFTCGELCTGDLFVYDGRNTLASEIGVYTTSVYLYVVGSTGNYMTVSYVIYYPFRDSQLLAQYTSSYRTPATCGDSFTEPSGSFGSANYSSNNGELANCTWNIRVDPNMQIVLTFSLSCFMACSHSLYVYDGPNTLSRQIGMYSGSLYESTVRSTGNYMTVSYLSDDTLHGEFRALYNSYHPRQVYCPQNNDSGGLLWNRTEANSTVTQSCDPGFQGNITRTCNSEGNWQLPVYNCTRETVRELEQKVSSLTNQSTQEEISNILEQLVDITLPETVEVPLTDSEITILSSSLLKIADILEETGNITDNMTDNFLDTTSNLLDPTNRESWQSLKLSKPAVAEKILSSMDSIGNAIVKQLEDTGEHNKTVIKTNVALGVRKVNETDVLYPEYKDVPDNSTEMWFYESLSNIHFTASAIKGRSEDYKAVTAIYRDMSDILPTTRRDGNVISEAKTQEINGPVLALSLLPDLNGTIDPPVTISFHHRNDTLGNPACSYWIFGSDTARGHWSSDDCRLKSTNSTDSICECTHLTNFAILMSPFVEANDSSDAVSMAKRTASLVSIIISIVGLTMTILVHIFMWRLLRSDRAKLLMNLCGALLIAYVFFLAAVDETGNKGFCTFAAVFLHYIYLVVFALMLAEGIDLALTVTYVFATKSRVKKLVLSAWGFPVLIVAISLGATQTEGYGNSSYCWLSVTNGVIWSFVGPALVIILANIVCLVIVFKAMFSTQAMKNRDTTDKVKASVRSLCVLIPVTGVSWILGLFYVDESASGIQILFAICNGLQGFFIFIFHCALNSQVRTAVTSQWRRRRSSTQSVSLAGILPKLRKKRMSVDMTSKRKRFGGIKLGNLLPNFGKTKSDPAQNVPDGVGSYQTSFNFIKARRQSEVASETESVVGLTITFVKQESVESQGKRQ